MTEEHIFPEAAGGRISRYLLCKPCNDRLGHWVDAPYLDQKHIQLVRAVNRIQGKTGKVPQPFSDTYFTDDLVKIRLDSKFVPVIVPQTPTVSVTENKEIRLEFSRDIRDVKEIPTTIRTTLSRFFRSEKGRQLGWTKEEQERGIQTSVEEAKQTQPKSEKIQSTLQSCWPINLKIPFVEHVKVIYELCCLEFGEHFWERTSAQRLRAFLLAQCTKNPEPWDWMNVTKHLNIVPEISSGIDDLINLLTDNNPHDYHVGIVAPTGAVCSMFGMGAIFHTEDLRKVSAVSNSPKVYLNSITGGKSGVFNLGELLANFNQK